MSRTQRRCPLPLPHRVGHADPAHCFLRPGLAASREAGRAGRGHAAFAAALCGRTRTTGRGLRSTPFSAELRTLCGLAPSPDRISAGQKRTTDESACTPGSVHGCLTASRWAVIHLGLPLPAGSSGLPAGIGRAALERLRRTTADRRPFLTLLRVGFTEPHRSPGVRWSLTPPFHPYQCEHWRSVLCGTVPRVTPGRC